MDCAMRSSPALKWCRNSRGLADGQSHACLYCPNADDLLAALPQLVTLDSGNDVRNDQSMVERPQPMLRTKLKEEGFGIMHGDEGVDVEAV